MKAIEFDIETQEIVIKKGKTNITLNPSTQNGMIILNTKCINVYSPAIGVGANIINSQISGAIKELNRWKKQCNDDGAKVANFTIESDSTDNTISNVNYELKY
jgi:hypothetical protein